jgi:ABC-type ATPase involved in cell division
MYVAELSQIEQDKIISKCRTVFESLAYAIDIEEELENVRNSKVSDILHIIGKLVLDK